MFQGGASYNLASISSEISEQYGIKFKVNTVLVASLDRKNESYKKQWEVLEGINAEQYQLIYVSALVHGETNKHGYYTKAKTAETLLSGEEFLVQIYSSSGQLLVGSNSILSAKNIIEYLPQP
ncbi:hypothetical protein NBRC116188_12590 [Oceaniserpentilla sp. 4NH20-0058]